MSKLLHPRCLYPLVLSLLVTGCAAKQGPAPVASAAEEAPQYDSLRAAVLQNHARGVHRTWALSSDRANDLLGSVQVFLAAPDDEALQVPICCRQEVFCKIIARILSEKPIATKHGGYRGPVAKRANPP